MNAPGGKSIAETEHDLRAYLVRIAGTLGDLLANSLSALYVHGSLATGAYHRERSDINLLGVVDRKLQPRERQQAARAMIRLSDARPTRPDICVNIVQERFVRSFTHPMPYETCYTEQRHEALRRGGVDFSLDETDVKLAAAVFETRERGVTLVGAPPAALFAPVPWYAHIAAVQRYFEERPSPRRQHCGNELLDACRVLHAVSMRVMAAANKDEAAAWALLTVPDRYRSALNDALQLYRGTKSIDDVVLREDDVAAFRRYVYECSKATFERANDSGDGEE